MSKLEELIEQYCPDGVEWKHLEEFCEIKTGKGITKKDSNENGTYPIISGGVTPMGYYHIFNREGRTVTISRVGANAGLVSFIDKRFYLNDKCFSIIPSNGTNTKFLYYILSAREADIKGMQSEGGVPTINTKKVGSIEIPVPPLPVQEEIVRVLDAFTELQAELQAELQKRKQQYNFYRDNLLSFEGRTDVQWKKLGKMCSILRGNRLTKSQLSSDGRYKVFHGGIEPIGRYDECNREANTTMVINVGASAGTVGFSKDMFWSSDGCFCLSHTPLFSGRYLYYYLQTREPYLMSRVRRAGIPTLDGKILEELIIPVPPVNEQNRIVSILDRFDTLTNDLTSGLPAEMEKRRQQYEYYRDRLLTFKRL